MFTFFDYLSIKPKFWNVVHKTSLPTTGEYLTDLHGNICPVLNTSGIDFSAAVDGRKFKPTLAVCAKGGEQMQQVFNGEQESVTYIAKPGDAIFKNGGNDQYVPDNDLKFDDLKKFGYRIVSVNEDGSVQVQSPPAKLLVGVVDGRVCIKDAWGAGEHQFLSVGATLKNTSDGVVTGIDPEGFEKWQIDSAPTTNNGPVGGTQP